MISFFGIVFYVHSHYLIFHVYTCPLTWNWTKRRQITFLHFRNWQSWQKVMSIFWSWKKSRKRLFPTFVQTLVQNMYFSRTVSYSMLTLFLKNSQDYVVKLSHFAQCSTYYITKRHGQNMTMFWELGKLGGNYLKWCYPSLSL